jgi:hypothetical protein
MKQKIEDTSFVGGQHSCTRSATKKAFIMAHDFLIAIHGSALTSASPADIDVIVGSGFKDSDAAAVQERVRAWAKARGLPADLPLDIQQADYIPQLPHCPLPAAYEVLQGALPAGNERRVQWDLAAWIRACQISKEAVDEFPFALKEPLTIDGSVRPQYRGLIGKPTGVVTFTVNENVGQFSGAYTGGGRRAVNHAIEKCDIGWKVVRRHLDANAINLVHSVPNVVRSLAAEVMEAFIVQGAPAGSGECCLTENGVLTAHQGLRTWEQITAVCAAIGSIRLLPGERSVLADFLAYEKAELRSKALQLDSLADELTDLYLRGLGNSHNANELRRRLRNLHEALPKPMRLNMEAIPLAELLQPAPDMNKVTLLNTSIMTAPGMHSLRQITVEQAKCVLAEAQYVESAVGHEATAQVMTELLGRTIGVNRRLYVSTPGSVAIVFKLKGRPPEGKVLSREEMEAYGYEIFLQIHQRDLQAEQATK